MSKFYKYLGGGYQFIAGVPARDLTEAEFNALPEPQQAEALGSGLYVASEPEAKQTVKEAPNG